MEADVEVLGVELDVVEVDLAIRGCAGEVSPRVAISMFTIGEFGLIGVFFVALHLK